MSKLTLRIDDMLTFIDTAGNEGFDDSRIEELESIINACNENMKDLDSENIADSIYDYLYDVLKQVKPNSKIFSEIWEDGGEDGITDYTDLLIKHPMMSIETAKSYTCDAIKNFISRLPTDPTNYFASYKINGHGIRVVYKDGVLVSATSRGRVSAARDLTQKLKWILGETNDALKDYGLVELRGELCLKIDKLDDARKFNEGIKSPFSAVSSLIKPSGTEEQAKLLDFLCYGFIVDGMQFDTRDEEFSQIESCGFTTPGFILIEGKTRADLEDMSDTGTIKEIISTFEELYETFGYFCDGVVFEVDDRQLFAELGTEGNHNCGNVALKVGIWKQDVYTGYVNQIRWERGKVKLSPVAIVSENADDIILDSSGKIENLDKLGIITAQGNRVKRVPLYEPKNILALEAYVGKPLSFRYGGEAGVVPCFPDGRMLKEDAGDAILLNNTFTREEIIAQIEKKPRSALTESDVYMLVDYYGYVPDWIE